MSRRLAQTEVEGTPLGDAIRRFRTARSMTMEELARSAGLSTAMISKVESGHGNPSINSLRDIARALNVPVAVLFADEEDDARSKHVLLNHKRMYSYGGATYTIILSPASHETRFLLLEAEPGAERGSATLPHQPHEGYEQGIVLEGELTYVVGGDTHVLRRFDTIAYPSTLPHSWVNRGDVTARAVWSITMEQYEMDPNWDQG